MAYVLYPSQHMSCGVFNCFNLCLFSFLLDLFYNSVNLNIFDKLNSWLTLA